MSLGKKQADDHQRVDELMRRFHRFRDRFDRYAAKVDRLEEVAQTASKVDLQEVDVRRSLTQLGAVEERLAWLEQRVAEHITADPEELVAARDVVDAVRREHDQVRIRLQLMTAYEERIRRLEAAVIRLLDKDVDPRFPQ